MQQYAFGNCPLWHRAYVSMNALEESYKWAVWLGLFWAEAVTASGWENVSVNRF